MPRILILLTLILLTTLSSYATTPPNLLFIIADDLTHRDIASYGGQASTPHLDRLASQGMRFTRCYQAAPMCSPTRHNIYTGLYPVRSGAYPNHTFVKPGVKSIAHYLPPLGYTVALAGKTHIAPKSAFPFQYIKSFTSSDIDNLFASAANNDKPFALFACSNEPHAPWNKGDASAYPPDQLTLPPYFVDTPITRENFSRYLAEITYFDSQVGDLLARLDQHGLADNTLVMVVSEQGNAFPFAKWTCYSSGLQSAMIVRWPGQVAANTTAHAMIEYVDITPTFIDAAGGDTTPLNLDGRSFLPVLQGQTDKHKTHAFGLMTSNGVSNGSKNYPSRTIASDRYRLILNLNPEGEFSNNVTQGSKNFNFFPSWREAAANGDEHAAHLVERLIKRPPVELYDLINDPLELNNLAGTDPQYDSVITELNGRLKGWMADQGDQGILTEIDAANRLNRGKNKQP